MNNAHRSFVLRDDDPKDDTSSEAGISPRRRFDRPIPELPDFRYAIFTRRKWFLIGSSVLVGVALLCWLFWWLYLKPAKLTGVWTNADDVSAFVAVIRATFREDGTGELLFFDKKRQQWADSESFTYRVDGTVLEVKFDKFDTSLVLRMRIRGNLLTLGPKNSDIKSGIQFRRIRAKGPASVP